MIRRPTPSDFQTERLARLDASVHTRVLANGLTVVYVPTEATSRFLVGMIVAAGPRLEKPAESGISHFLEHMMFRGSTKFPGFADLAREFEWLGGEWNAETGYESTNYWYSGVEQTALAAIDLFAEFLENPLFREIDVERKIILRELDGELNEFDNSTDVDSHIATLLWPGSSLAQPILGSRSTLDAINVDKLKEFRDRVYVPNNMVLYVSGGDQSSVMNRIETAFSTHRAGLKTVPKPTFPGFLVAEEPRVKCVADSDNEYQIKLSFRTEGEWSLNALTYELISRLLTDGFCSRLNTVIREKLGLVYDLDAAYHHRIDTGSFDITAVVRRENFDAYFENLYRELARLAKDGPTLEELDLMRVRSIVDLELTPQAGYAGRLAWAKLAGQPLSLVEERRRLCAITRDDVHAVCSSLFRPENAALVAIGPEESALEGKLKERLSRFR